MQARKTKRAMEDCTKSDLKTVGDEWKQLEKEIMVNQPLTTVI